MPTRLKKYYTVMMCELDMFFKLQYMRAYFEEQVTKELVIFKLSLK